DLSIDKWDIIIIQVESLFRIEFSARPFVAILDEANAIMRQMSSGTNARESENAMRDVLRSARHVLAMDTFANISTLTFLQIYRGENIRVVDNKYQPRIGETVEFIYDPNSGAEAMRIGYDLLRQGKRVAFVSTGAVMARALVEKASKLSKPDNSPVRARAYYGDMDGRQRQKDFSDINVAWGELDCVAYTNTVEAGISFEVTGHFDIIIAITNIATPVHVEALAQMLYRIHDCPRHMSIEDWNNICNRKFVENFSPPEARKHFLRLSYFRRQGHNEESAMKGLKAEENVQWEFACYRAEENLEKSVAKDLRKSYSANHWEVIQELFRILGFTGIDDRRTLSGDTASESFTQSCERFIEIRNQSLLLFGFKSRAKKIPDLKSAIQAINAIAGNWCGYTVKSDKKRIGPREKQ
ncbi:9841_t:CDS:2, partial [Funneliformis geosporum]